MVHTEITFVPFGHDNIVNKATMDEFQDPHDYSCHGSGVVSIGAANTY